MSRDSDPAPPVAFSYRRAAGEEQVPEWAAREQFEAEGVLDARMFTRTHARIPEVSCSDLHFL